MSDEKILLRLEEYEALKQENERLKAELRDERLANSAGVSYEKIISHRVMELEATNAALVKVLTKYGNHRSRCGTQDPLVEGPCTCGFREALAKADAMREEECNG